jgi:arsenate reductase
MAGDRFDVHSAGTDATLVRPEAIAAMAEIGIDISGQTSKSLARYLHADVGWLITVCDQAREACPTLPGVRRQLHWSIEDPAAISGNGRMAAFRAARDELHARIDQFIEASGRPPAG